jgi:hypothetical protein
METEEVKGATMDASVPHRKVRKLPGHFAKKFLHGMAGFLRVASFLTVVCLLASVVALRSARASLGESAVIIGREIAALGDLVGSAYRIRLNGESLYVASATLKEPPSEVLDRLENYCRGNAGGLKDLMAHLPEEKKKELLADGAAPESLGILRTSVENEGFVSCFAQRSELTATNFMSRLEKAIRSGDMSEFGDLRYFYVRGSKETGSHVVTVLSMGRFNLMNVFPSDGSEPPGTDSPTVARPAHSKRLLSAEVEGVPNAVRLYEVKGTEQDVLKHFDAELAGKGWQNISLERTTLKAARAFSHEGRDLFVFAETMALDKTVVSMIETNVPKH